MGGSKFSMNTFQLEKEIGEEALSKQIALETQEKIIYLSKLDPKLLQEVWELYKNDLDSRKQNVLMLAAQSVTPALIAENQLEFKVGNLSFKQMFDSDKSNFDALLEQKLRLRHIGWHILIDEVEIISSYVRPATPREKLERMAGLNPLILELRKRLELGLD